MPQREAVKPHVGMYRPAFLCGTALPCFKPYGAVLLVKDKRHVVSCLPVGPSKDEADEVLVLLDVATYALGVAAKPFSQYSI